MPSRKLDAAEMFLSEAADQARAAGFPFFEATAQRHLAAALLRRDPQSADANHLLDQVGTAAAHHGCAIEGAAVAALRAE